MAGSETLMANRLVDVKDMTQESIQRLQEQNASLSTRLERIEGMLQVLISTGAKPVHKASKHENHCSQHEIPPLLLRGEHSVQSISIVPNVVPEPVEHHDPGSPGHEGSPPARKLSRGKRSSAGRTLFGDAAEAMPTRKIARIVMTKKKATTQIQRIVQSSWFEFFWCGVVFINAIALGIQVELNAQNPSSDVPHAFVVIGAIFALLFVVEIVIRFLADGSFKVFFWLSDDYLWNIFDSLIVLLCIFDSIVEIVAFGADVVEWRQLANTRIVRMVRVLRLVRAVRILKVVRNIGALRTLIRSTINTMAHVGWAVVLIVLVVYIVGLVFTDAVSMYASENLTPQGLSVADVNPNLVWFGSGLHLSCQTLWWSVTGGINYADAVNVMILIDGGWVWGYIYDFYMAFMFLGALNVMTGVVCETAIECTERENEHELALGAINRDEAAAAMKRLHAEMARLEADEPAAFDQLMKDDWFSSFMANIECDQPEVGKGLFNELFDKDGDGEVDLDEFVEGCLRLKWPAKAFDIAAIKIDMLRMHKILTEIHRGLKQNTL